MDPRRSIRNGFANGYDESLKAYLAPTGLVKKRGSGQSHNDKKGDHGDRHETKRSGHLPAAPLAPEEVLQNEENEEKQQEVEGNEDELEESSPPTTAEKNCHLLVVLVAAAMLVLIDFQLSKKIISGLWNYNNS